MLTEPKGYDLPDRDYSLDPARVVQPEPLYGCGVWVDGKPQVDEKIFADIAFVRRELEDPYDAPYPRHIEIVKRHGGQIVHRFNVPAVRAWISTARIESLAAERDVLVIFKVANLRRYDVAVFVGYNEPYSYVEGAIRFAQLGGRVGSTYNSFNSLFGILPDQAIPVLRNSPHVEYVEDAGWFCPG